MNRIELAVRAALPAMHRLIALRWKGAAWMMAGVETCVSLFHACHLLCARASPFAVPAAFCALAFVLASA